jgi:hypothetical protein
MGKVIVRILLLFKYFEVWNDLGNCGSLFQKGETYLVYATDDEETDRLETGVHPFFAHSDQAEAILNGHVDVATRH